MTSPRDLAVASYNIHKGIGTDRRRDLARTVAVISEIGADILALQEADTRFGTRTGLLDLESIRRDLGLIAVPLTVWVRRMAGTATCCWSAMRWCMRCTS